MESNGEENQGEVPKTPLENNYMAGAMLANGISFVWLQLLTLLGPTASNAPIGLLVDLSYIIFIAAGYISSTQVLKRTETDHLKVGLKTAFYSSIMGLLIVYSLLREPTMRLAASISLCYFAGSILASYRAVKRRIYSEETTT